MKNSKNENIKNILGFLLIISIILMLSSNTFALTGSIRPARIILYQNITNNTINLINGSVYVKNVNEIPVNVSISTSGNIDTDVTFFTLYPNQEREIKFTVFIWRQGNYSMSIIATFSAENEISVGVSSEIIVYANATSSANNNKAPRKPNLLSPANKTFINASKTTLTLRWSSASDDDSSILAYYYEVDDSQDFSSPLIYGWTLKIEKTITLRDGTWYWRVKVTDGKYENVSDTWVIFVGNYNVTTTTTSTTTLPTTTTIQQTTIPSPTTTTIQNPTTTTLQTTTTTTSTTTTTLSISSGGGSSGGGYSQSSITTTTISNNSTSRNNSSLNETEEPLIGSIRPPRMVLRCEAPCNLSGWVEVSNVNNYSIKVKTQAMGDFYDNIKLSTQEFVLAINEKKIVNFTIPIKRGGNYNSVIIFTFSPLEKNEPNLALACDIIIIANQSSDVNNESTSNTTTTIKEGDAPTGMIVAIAKYGVIALIPIVAIIIFIIWNRRKEPLGKKMIKKWMKRNAIFLIFFLSLIIFSNLSFAYGNANIAVVLKNASKISDFHERPIIELLRSLDYNVNVVDSLIDFSNFDAIIILARECLSNDNLGSFAANIPVNSYPTLVVGCGYFYEWGWISIGGSGKITSTGRHSITISNSSHPITKGYNGTLEVHFSSGYPITYIEKYKTNMKSLATYSTSSSSLIIAYAESNTKLSNGNNNKERIVFFGVNYPLYWTNVTKEMFVRSVEWIIDDADRDGVRDRIDKCPNTNIGEPVDSDGCACYQKSCDDKVECTIDYCNLENAACIHELNHSYCSHLSGIYNFSKWIDIDQCRKREIFIKEKREYTCSLSGCIYEILESVTTETSNVINKVDNTPCDDNLWCTVNDTCQAGVCRGIRIDGECSCNEDCTSKCEGDILFKGICNNCSCSVREINCKSLDDWYETNETRWVDIDYKTQGKEFKKEYRVHYCSLEGCKYNVTNEIWIRSNETRIRLNGLIFAEGMKYFVSGNERAIIVTIDNSSNISKKFEGIKEIILKDSNNNNLVKFYFDFSSRNLNLSNLVIKKNEDPRRGSLVMYGLNSSLLANQNKTIWIERKLNTNHVCIKDSEILSANEISSNCNATNEFLIRCDGRIYNASNGARYSCTISSNYYIVSGLRNSGVIEKETCNDGIKNQGEIGIDCGGPCTPCQNTTTTLSYTSSSSFKRLECHAPSSIIINEGEVKILRITTINVGNVALYNVRASLSGISKDWYNITSQISKIEAHTDATFELTLKGIKIGDYNITFDAYDSSSLLCSNKINLKVNEKVTTTIYNTTGYYANQNEIEKNITEKENFSKITETSSTIDVLKIVNKEEGAPLFTGMVTLFKENKILFSTLIISLLFVSILGFYITDYLKTKKNIENAYKKYEEWKKKNGGHFDNIKASNKKSELRKKSLRGIVR